VWADLRGIALVLRAWRLRQVASGAAAAALAWWLVPAAPVPIPAADGASSVLWPLVPALVAVTGPPFLSTADRDLERGASRSHHAVRALGLGAFWVLTAVAVAAGGRFDLLVVLRNTLLLTGLATGCAACLPAAAAWAPVALVPMTMWLLGTDPTTRHVRVWAVLLAPHSSMVALSVALVAAAFGAAAYLGRPWLTSDWWTTTRRPRPG
jgi:hypothetical protein